MIGEIHTLHIRDKSDRGFILTKDADIVVLPYVLADKELTIGDDVQAFMYADKSGRIIASTTLPRMQVGTFGWAEVVEVLPNLGAFVNIGTSTDV
ncbi:MAG TPA: S1-like domain-containing RNA-binding protein, partial [Pseudogracilibacillus sp.]|nr:S1-like domain-containing RNA-binding protein [Pseudogracilibacillus sp.]